MKRSIKATVVSTLDMSGYGYYVEAQYLFDAIEFASYCGVALSDIDACDIRAVQAAADVLYAGEFLKLELAE